MQHICLHKEIVFQNALRYNFALLGPAVFVNLRLYQAAGALSNNIFGQDEHFPTG